MQQFSALRPIVRGYVYTIVLVGGLVLSLSIRSLFVSAIGSEWLILAGLTILTGSFSVKVPSINAYISVSEAFVFASVLLFGAEAGTLTVLLECLVILLWMKPQGRPTYRLFFNLAAPSVAIWFSGQAFYLLSGIKPYSQTFTPLPQLFIPLLAFTAAYFVLNSFLVAVAVGLETQRPPLHIWWKNFAWLSINYFSGASLAALIVTYTQRLEFSTLAVIVPLLVVSYLTFRTAMGRAEDSYNHLSELNRLYLSTIETLAMAIDAKDQVTHGHIRRVQEYAVGLARQIGVADSVMLKAIEAAALLHDMGKLAIPEHILNKPGKLTAAEFETMKLHAGIGAEILSAIDFPYPVVPIVRHHHENWDGSGYPDRLSGTDIPIGARILSVVDCFDALTSDRPYRPRLSDDDAIKILNDRRGSMYDPLVVDTFVRIHKSLAPDDAQDRSTKRTDIFGFSQLKSGINHEAPSTVMAEGPKRDLRETPGSDAAADKSAILEILRAAVPHRAALWFRRNQNTNRLDVLNSFGLSETTVDGLRLSVGQRLSGWVAANGDPILNSDPSLDLGEIAHSLNLTHTISVAATTDDSNTDVLTIYRGWPFDESELTLLSLLASTLASRATRATEPSVEHVSEVPQRTVVSAVAAVVSIRIENVSSLSQLQGADRSRQCISMLAKRLRDELTTGDLLVHSREDELAVLISRHEAHQVRRLLRQLRGAADDVNYGFEDGTRLDLTFDAILAPLDPVVLWNLVSTDAPVKARRRDRLDERVH